MPELVRWEQTFTSPRLGAISHRSALFESTLATTIDRERIIVTAEELSRAYGEEYPAAVIRDGVRLPLKRETRFSRHYQSGNKKAPTLIVSRFMDRSASMTFAQLVRDWPTLSTDERVDFCNECSWLNHQPDFPEIIRFVVQHSSPQEWSAIAQVVASRLPQDEAFDLLVRALRSSDRFPVSNLAQGIACTKHPQAEPTLREHLSKLWRHRSLWDDDSFLNWVAYDATTCIEHLIELGAAPEDFESQVRQLAEHVCSGNRDSCRRFLSKYYVWL